MKKFTLVIILILSFQLGQSQFSPMPLFYPNDGFYYSSDIISIVDADHIWVATTRRDMGTLFVLPYTKAITTNDGGYTWQFLQIPVPGSPFLSDVEAYSDSICYYFVDDINTGNSDIWKTTDAGATWRKKTTTQYTFYGDCIHLFSKDTLVAIGDPDALGYFNIQNTNDGGETWSRVPPANIPPILPNEAGFSGKSYSAKGNTIWFSTCMGRCFKSTDKGHIWTVSNVDTSYGPQVAHVCFSDQDHGIFYCGAGRYYRTYDGGTTWSDLTMLQNLSIPGISSVNGIFEGFVIAAADTNDMFHTSVYYTDDFFTTLTFLDFVILSSNYIYFKDSRTGWLGGLWRADSNIFKFNGVLTSIRDKHIVQGTLIITPNPSIQSSLVTFPSEFINEKKILRIFSISGKLMTEYYLPANVKSIELNAAEYSNGVYFIELISATGLNKITRWVVIH
jgi:photosystem II stability/assembly factor-like uncharacterized protein